MIFIQAVEFKAEKHQRRGVFGDLILRVGHKFGAVAVHRVLVIAQTRERHDPACDDVDLLIGQNAVQHGRCIKACQLALISRRKIGAGGLQPCHIAGEFRAVGAGVKIGQIPIGKVAERACTRCIGVKQRCWQSKCHREPHFHSKDR